jgi:SAM-dependent methyltransferase
VELKEVQRHWNAFGKIDPLWAIVTQPEKRFGKWKPAEFFACGEEEIDRILRHVESLPFPLRRGRALDFGCGVGRLTQALNRHFRQCDGVDIAPSMIKLARKYDRPWRRFRYEMARLGTSRAGRRQGWADCWPGFARLAKGQKIRFILNDSNNLALLADDSYDFIYSSLVLQHIRPEYSQNYIKEFLRVLAPGGLAVFQIPSQPMKECETLYHASIRMEQASLTVKPGAQITLTAHVKNISGFTWPAVNLGNHWLSEAGELLVNDDGRAPLPVGMLPGQEVAVSIPVTVPRQPGRYWLEFDLVRESVTWFHPLGSETARILCEVRANGINPSAFFRRVKNRVGASRGYRLGGKVYRKLLSGMHKRIVSPGFEPIMEIYGVPKDALTKWIETHGGRIVQIQEDFSVGKDWESFRYYVTKA